MERIFKQCRISKRYRGYRQLQACVRIAMEDESQLLYVTGIYKVVGREFHTSPSGIERNIRTVIKCIWNSKQKSFLDELAGMKLEEQPTSGELIEILVCYLKDSEKRQRSYK